jgi:predicted nucleic acid-binding protein
MKYVLDASVALKWVLNEPHSDKARRLRDDFKQLVHELLAPTTFVAEIGHALTRAERKGIIKPPMAAAFFSDVLSTPPVFHDFVPLMPSAVARSSAVRIGTYDCLYVGLAERERCKVVTADQRVLALFPLTTVALDSLP